MLGDPVKQSGWFVFGVSKHLLDSFWTIARCFFCQFDQGFLKTSFGEVTCKETLENGHVLAPSSAFVFQGMVLRTTTTRVAKAPKGNRLMNSHRMMGLSKRPS